MLKRLALSGVSAAILLVSSPFIPAASAQTYSCGGNGVDYASHFGPVGSQAYESALEHYFAYCNEYGGGGGGSSGGGGVGGGSGGGGLGLGDICTRFQCNSDE